MKKIFEEFIEFYGNFSIIFDPLDVLYESPCKKYIQNAIDLPSALIKTQNVYKKRFDNPKMNKTEIKKTKQSFPCQKNQNDVN